MSETARCPECGHIFTVDQDEKRPRMERNADGSWFCWDCWRNVVLFDDDVHDCEGETITRGPNAGSIVVYE